MVVHHGFAIGDREGIVGPSFVFFVLFTCLQTSLAAVEIEIFHLHGSVAAVLMARCLYSFSKPCRSGEGYKIWFGRGQGQARDDDGKVAVALKVGGGPLPPPYFEVGWGGLCR